MGFIYKDPTNLKVKNNRKSVAMATVVGKCCQKLGLQLFFGYPETKRFCGKRESRKVNSSSKTTENGHKNYYKI